MAEYSYNRLSLFLPWISEQLMQRQPHSETKTSCQPEFWCDFIQGRDPTIIVVLSVILCLALLLTIYLCVRKSSSSPSSYKVNNAFSKQEDFSFNSGLVDIKRVSTVPVVHQMNQLVALAHYKCGP